MITRPSRVEGTDLSKPVVTIGLCVKNCEKTIKDTIRSIIAQDYPHELIEIIVVDGCSRDRTVRIIKKMLRTSDINTRIFFEDKGLGLARQIVVNNSKGEFIIWVDGDMILTKDFVKKQVEYMEQNPHVGIVKGRYGFTKESSLVAFLENLDFLTAFDEVKDFLLASLGASGSIYRVNTIKQIGGFDENITGAGEDTDVEYRIRAAGWKLCIGPAIFYERRRKTWKALWEEYFWHGKGGFQLYKKNANIIVTWKIFPLTLLFKKFIQVKRAYKMTHYKGVFMLPVHYIFKRIAWFFGFLTEYVKWYLNKITKSKPLP